MVASFGIVMNILHGLPSRAPPSGVGLIHPQRTVFLSKPTETCQPFGVPSFPILTIILVFRHFTVPRASRHELREITGYCPLGPTVALQEELLINLDPQRYTQLVCRSNDGAVRRSFSLTS